MSDERLIRALRALDRPVEVAPPFGDALYAVLADEYASRRQFRPSLTLLLVAALVTALLLGGAIGVGSGLLRLPWTSDRFPALPGAAGCPADLPADQLLELWVNGDGYADPNDEWGPPAGAILRLYDDGLLLTAGHGRTVEQIQAADSGMTSRRLSPTGVRLMLEAAEKDWRGAAACRDGWADIPGGELSFRGADGLVDRIAWGRHSGSARVMTPKELEAVGYFVDRMLDPRSWLPAEAWIDGTDRPYVPDRWIVNVQLPDLLGLADPEGAFERQRSLPSSDGMVLPGGATLLTFGDSYQEPDGAKARGQPGLHGRCAVVGADAARSVTDAFSDAGAVAFNGNWWFRHGSDDGWSSAADLVAVQIRPLLPTDDGCSARMLGLAGQPGPSPSPVPEPSGDLATVLPCSFLSEASVRVAMELPSTKPISVAEPTPSAEMERIDLESRVCRYHIGETWDDPSIFVYVRTWSTEVAEARILAREILGDSAIEEAVDDRTVWRNRCAMDYGAHCVPALAVSLDPYFIAITFEGHLQGDITGIARTLTSAIATE